MSTPVPVPSKAAIRALRGLVLGTTCTLALVTEDRRRRINAAQRALSNGERLKSSTQYRPGAALDVISSKEEEAFLLESWPFPRRNHYDADQRSRSGPRERDHDPRVLDGPGGPPPTPTAVVQERGGPRAVEARLRPTFGRRLGTAGPKKPPPVPSEAPVATSLYTSAAAIAALVKTGRSQQLGDAAALLKQTLELPEVRSLEPGRSELLQSTAMLCRACQDAGRMDDALTVLRAVLSLGTIDEETYFAHDPLSIVEDLLLRERPDITPSRAYKLAVDLYTPNLKGDPGLRGHEMLQTAEKLIERGTKTGRYTLVKQILFQRVNWYLGEPGACQFLRRVFRRMHEKDMFEAVIRYFLSCSQYHQHLMTDQDEYYSVCDLVVQCVSESNGYRAAEVLQCLRKHQPADVNMRVSWVSELLYAHWKKGGSYNETVKLFFALREDGIPDLVAYPDGVYRSIIQVALEAGNETAARRHFDELISHQPKCSNNVRILGLFALARARTGDWEAVDSLFQKMYPVGAVVSKHGSDVLVPILKEFRASHTVEETEAFVKHALQDLKIPLAKYMVTLVANEYGSVRDVKSFLAWLRYCSAADFEMDATFSNAILTSCRNHWNFRFMDLRRVQRALQSYGASFADGVTDNIMTGAALSSPASHRKVVLALALRGKCARPKPKKSPLVRGRFDPAAVSTAMATWIEVGRPEKAVRTYRFMTASGMPHCPQCLRLFSAASMKLGTGNLNGVLHMLQEVKKAGVDISEAVVALFTVDLDSTDRNLGKRHAETHVRNVLQGMQRYGLRASSLLLNKAATVLAKSGNHDGAAGLALMAAETRGEAPGFNVTNFKILFDAYSITKQWEQLSNLLKAAEEFGWWARIAGRHTNLLKRLKYLWRVEMDKPGGGGPALKHLETAIRNIKLHRDKLKDEQVAVQKGVLEILAAAAVESGCDARELEETVEIEEDRRSAYG